MSEQPILVFATAAEFRKWLTRNHADHPGIWLKIAKKASGVASVTYAQALDEGLFERPSEPRTWMQVIAWWEARRIPYNLIVGIVGAVSLFFYFLFVRFANGLAPGEDAIEPLALIFAPFAINAAYTAGWIVEILLRSAGAGKSMPMGSVLLKAGVLFSVVVVMLPSTIWGFTWLWRAIH